MNRAVLTLAGLIAGVAAGSLAAARGWPAADALAAAKLVGTLWLDALRMTVLPLVVTLTATGTARAVAAARGGAVIRRAGGLGLILLVASAAVAVVLGPLLLSAWSPPPTALATPGAASLGTPGAGAGAAVLA